MYNAPFCPVVSRLHVEPMVAVELRDSVARRFLREERLKPSLGLGAAKPRLEDFAMDEPGAQCVTSSGWSPHAPTLSPHLVVVVVAAHCRRCGRVASHQIRHHHCSPLPPDPASSWSDLVSSWSDPPPWPSRLREGVGGEPADRPSVKKGGRGAELLARSSIAVGICCCS